ncbi:MAG: PQQ-dependent sugar dehydrogenase [Gammaproteobacteria bacterium]|nr:PQQ-dependent sugar dehydrogenase [Gammaproteobacteria bacterium]MDH4315309.1 PQQ-dependent sugar dehydrogenase [Gammaproteobacteria bacterium]MDH5213424.1 PQQ-dependent sugar dehydrogenase [Gammaproteobacteria bacterium]MDH5500963.1 PQQ-dependent sugar dehydrogenase [Gammaproteobacteria bacterium]
MRRMTIMVASILVASCATADSESWPFDATPLAGFNEPWAMTFLPDGRLLLTEKPGRLLLVAMDGSSKVIFDDVPDLAYGGQGGLGDVVLHPDFQDNQRIYLSYAEQGDGDLRGAAVARAELDLAGERITDFEVIWRQDPKVTGRGHYGHRIAFSPDGYLFISSGERQKFDPAQDMRANLGKILRLHDDGSVPGDNPFSDQGGVTAQIWTLGHRNPLGLAFDQSGRLWNHEMGPQHGDELNLVVRGENYGYPIVSNGDHYDGTVIPDHDTRPEFAAPKAYWVPSIAPAGFIIYSGTLFPDWKGDGFIGGLVSKALVRVEFNGSEAREAARYDMGRRIREIEQGPDGSIWLLEDAKGGRLLRLTPK